MLTDGVPLQAQDSWAGEIDPNLFPLQIQTASGDWKELKTSQLNQKSYTLTHNLYKFKIVATLCVLFYNYSVHVFVTELGLSLHFLQGGLFAKLKVVRFLYIHGTIVVT